MKVSRTFFASMMLSTSLFASTSVMADAGVFVGVVYEFGPKPDIGLSLKVVSDDKTDKAVGALGVSYFPSSTHKLGADISVGYTLDDVLDDSVITVGYDIFKKKPQVGIGYMDTKKE
jgi:hypothetical protein